MAGGCGQTSVARQQWRFECFGERDIGGVIGCEIVPQLPNAGQKQIVRVPSQGKIRQVGKSHTAAISVDLTICGVATDHLRDFHVEQMRRMERSTRGEQPIFHDFCRRCAEKDLKQGRSVNDNHMRSRSARTASAGGTDGAVSVRLRKRARNSSIVGRSATSRISLSR